MIHISHKKVKMKKTPGHDILAADDLCLFFKKENKQKIKDETSSWRTYWNTLRRACYLHIE